MMDDRHRRRAAFQPLRGRFILAAAAFAVVQLMLLGLSHESRAFVYYGDTSNYALGRADIDGQRPLDPFLSRLGSTNLPCGVAVDGRYVYWGDKIWGNIGRARVDGSGRPDPNFVVGASEPCGLSVYDHHLYWVNQSTKGSIGRASLKGPLDVHENFVPSEAGSDRDDLYEPCGVAVDTTGVYWTNAIGGSVGHANPDGSGERTLIQSGSAQGCGVAVSGGYVYWAHNPYSRTASIGRASELGANADSTFITGLNQPCGLAAYSHYLYFADGATVDRTDLYSADPTAATEQIVLGTKDACGVAADSLYAGRLTITARHRGPHATARLTVSVSDPGTITFGSAPGRSRLVALGRARLPHAGRTTIILRPTSRARRELGQRGHLKVRLRIVYTPAGGIATTRITDVTLVGR